jgi:pimeloyl-ACP methyl ester carboxylesterase
MAFLELGKQLAQNNWGMCTYDRLGYGRSSVLPRYLTIEKRAEILDKLIQQLLADQSNKKVIIGGWSAGVELSSIYAKLYPVNVQGMLFIDGYPNYLDLMAINDNKSQRVEAGTLGTLWITRVL